MNNVGEDLMCVHNYANRQISKHVTIGKIYTSLPSVLTGGIWRVTNDNGITWHYPNDHFITLGDYRERQINKLL